MSSRFSVPPSAFPSPNQPSFSLFAPFVQFSSRFPSTGCALLLRSFLSRATSARDAVVRKLTRLFSVISALFAQTAGVAWVFLIKGRSSFRRFTLSLVKSILTKTHFRKLFRMNTYEKTGGGGGYKTAAQSTAGSAAQSLLCFSVFFRLSGITFVPDGAGPAFRALRRASVAASSFFFFRIPIPLALPVYIRAIKRNYIALMTRHTSIPVTMLALALSLHASPLNAQQSPVNLPNGRVLTEAPGHPRPINNLPTNAVLSPDKKFAVFLHSGYGSYSSGKKQSLTVLNLE